MKISVIIPAFNEAAAIEKTLQNVKSQSPYEIIVVDGGSDDNTVTIAKQYGKVLVSGKGRAKQLNAGAKEARGDVFVFLHADTLLPEQGLQLIELKIVNGAKAGRFRMKFDDSRWVLKLFASYTRFHCFSYGDQCFFVRREIFNQLEGYDESLPFEDIDFYKRLRKIERPQIIKLPVITSARRFVKVGCIKQKFINISLLAFYYSGLEIGPFKQSAYRDIR